MRDRASSCGLAVILLLLALPGVAGAAPAPVRNFQIRYTAKIPAIAAGQQVRIWMPYPESDGWQTITNVSVESPYAHSMHRDPEYGNAILYMEGAPPASEATVTLTFDVSRREYVNRPGDASSTPVDHVDPTLLNRFRQRDHLIPLDGKIAEVGREATAGKRTPSDKSRAIYDYVTTHLKYDKSGSGWGRGDAVWACDAKRGNCTDYHSLLIGMARSQGIPAKFEIGIPVPDDKTEGDIGGYHCWAAFYLDGEGWVPMDSSEASKFPAKRDYFYGALDTNRVRLSVGRDLQLDPPQHGARVNFFVYPYVEVDGQPLSGVTQAFAFRDLGSKKD